MFYVIYANNTKNIEEAETVLIKAGAGMGVGSSLPDFRGNEGSSMFLELVKEKDKNYFIFTSNVEGSFKKRVLTKGKIKTERLI